MFVFLLALRQSDISGKLIGASKYAVYDLIQLMVRTKWNIPLLNNSPCESRVKKLIMGNYAKQWPPHSLCNGVAVFVS